LLLICCQILVSGASSAAPQDSAISFALEEPFDGEGLTIKLALQVGGYGAFDVVAADMDLDEDMDVFINWHLAGVELFENTGEGLVVLNGSAADVSGVGHLPGVPSLFARRGSTLDELGGESAEGIHVWHENPTVWSLLLVPPADGPATLLSIYCNEKFTQTDGLLEGESVSEDGKQLELKLEPGSPPRLLHLTNVFPSSNLRLDQADDGTATWPYHIGRDPSVLATPAVSLRKPDPHGIAWVQAIGSAEPELIILRGGNRGTLAPPDLPKSNRVFVYEGEQLHYRQLDPQLAPSGFGRARGLEWVDLDNDGINELCIGNMVSPNMVWFLDREQGDFRDRAKELHLNHWRGDVSAWIDLDNDGWQDQLLVSLSLLRVTRNLGPEGFQSVPAKSYGLSLGGTFNLRSKGFEKTCISVFDIDADGALDIWVSSLGAARFHRIFRRAGERFVDVTEALGLDKLKDTENTVRFDVDNDGYIDVLALGKDPILLWNRAGKHFEQIPLPDVVAELSRDEGMKSLIFAATSADMDSDGRIDLILVGQSRQIAYNRTKNNNRHLVVHLRQDTDEPIGALVRLHTDDGRSPVQRYGSANRSFVSQVLQPLHFGIAADTQVTKLEVLWPGETVWTACELPADKNEVRLVRESQ
jgi:hypothetical protein